MVAPAALLAAAVEGGAADAAPAQVDVVRARLHEAFLTQYSPDDAQVAFVTCIRLSCLCSVADVPMMPKRASGLAELALPLCPHVVPDLAQVGLRAIVHLSTDAIAVNLLAAAGPACLAAASTAAQAALNVAMEPLPPPPLGAASLSLLRQTSERLAGEHARQVSSLVRR